jgi:prevent-host-death family protein
MERTFDLNDARHQLSRLVRLVEAGEEIVLTREGRPVARMVPYQPSRPDRRPGLLKGQVTILPGFDEFG